MLTPIVYTPEVKPKKIAPKKSRIQMRVAGSVDETGETEEAFEAAGSSQTAPPGSKSPLQNFAPGDYTLKMKVMDKKRNQTLTPTATFTVT